MIEAGVIISCTGRDFRAGQNVLRHFYAHILSWAQVNELEQAEIV